MKGTAAPSGHPMGLARRVVVVPAPNPQEFWNDIVIVARGLPAPLPRLRNSPTGRNPQWVLDEALERQGLSDPAGHRQRRRRADRGVDRGATASDLCRRAPPTRASSSRRTSWWAAPVGECCGQFAGRPVDRGVPGKGPQPPRPLRTPCHSLVVPATTNEKWLARSSKTERAADTRRRVLRVHRKHYPTVVLPGALGNRPC